jgi:molybdenum cofactor guanylyltransferase
MHSTLERDITGIILVGGKSLRMGRDKAFLQIAGKPLFEGVLEVFRDEFERIVLAGDRAERFSACNLPVIPDIYPGSALGGIFTGLHHAETRYIFVSSCDLPFPNGEILRYICSLRDGFDAVVPSTANGHEPLFALYSKSCLKAIKGLLERGECCAYAYFHQIRVRYVPHEEIAALDREGTAFLNINTPEDFAKIGGKL